MRIVDTMPQAVGSQTAGSGRPGRPPKSKRPRVGRRLGRAPAESGPPFVIRRSRIQGRGAFATRDIEKGDRIIEYEGERVSEAEADRRYDAPGRHHTFVFMLSSGRCIDGGVAGNAARFINHSCDPNCEAIEDRGRIYIDALRAIARGEELVYDYAYEPPGEVDDHVVYFCSCGSEGCRQTIIKPKKPRKKKRARKPAAAGGARRPAARRTSRGRRRSA